MKIKKGISLIDQHDKYGMWGPYGGNFLPETLKKPVNDLDKGKRSCIPTRFANHKYCTLFLIQVTFYMVILYFDD